jgi:large subunit ribosomal protein L25
MAESLKLSATIRKEKGKGGARRLRQRGMLPGILYGHKTASTPLTIDQKQFEQLIIATKSEHKLFSLSVEGDKKPSDKTVMIKEIQVDPVTRIYLHVDLFEVSMDEEITIAMTVKLVGEAEGVKTGGVLQQVKRELEIKCLPSQIPEALTIDVSALRIGDSIHLKDVQLPFGIKVLEDADLTIATVLAPTVEKEVVEAAAEVKPEEEAAAAGEAEEKKAEGKKAEDGDKASRDKKE